jgi:hypothetical protein
MNDIRFSERQTLAIRRLAKRRGQTLTRAASMSETGLTAKEYDELLARLEEQGCVAIVPVDEWIYANAFSIEPRISMLAEQLATPEEEDYPKKAMEWFSSHWWCMPILVGLAVLGAAEALVAVLAWLGWGQ